MVDDPTDTAGPAGQDRIQGSAAHRVELTLSPDQYEFLRRLLWGVGMAYQAADGGPTDGVLRMGDLPGDFRDLMAVVAAARRA